MFHLQSGSLSNEMSPVVDMTVCINFASLRGTRRLTYKYLRDMFDLQSENLASEMSSRQLADEIHKKSNS